MTTDNPPPRKSKRRLQQLAQTSSPPSPTPSGLSIQHLRATIRHIERSLESEFIETIDGAPPAATAADANPPNIYHNNTPLDQVVIKAQLKECQFRMAFWLNQLPFKKYLTWWPEVTNAHATAIVRCVKAHCFGWVDHRLNPRLGILIYFLNMKEEEECSNSGPKSCLDKLPMFHRFRFKRKRFTTTL